MNEPRTVTPLPTQTTTPKHQLKSILRPSKKQRFIARIYPLVTAYRKESNWPRASTSQLNAELELWWEYRINVSEPVELDRRQPSFVSRSTERPEYVYVLPIQDDKISDVSDDDNDFDYGPDTLDI